MGLYFFGLPNTIAGPCHTGRPALGSAHNAGVPSPRGNWADYSQWRRSNNILTAAQTVPPDPARWSWSPGTSVPDPGLGCLTRWSQGSLVLSSTNCPESPAAELGCGNYLESRMLRLLRFVVCGQSSLWILFGHCWDLGPLFFGLAMTPWLWDWIAVYVLTRRTNLVSPSYRIFSEFRRRLALAFRFKYSKRQLMHQVAALFLSLAPLQQSFQSSFALWLPN